MMAAPDNNSYYAGICVAIIAGYLLSWLRIERLVLAGILLLPERLGGSPAKNQMIAVNEKDTIDFKEHLPPTTITSGWTDENMFELERRAIFSKACEFNAQCNQSSDRARTRLGFLQRIHLGFRSQETTALTKLPVFPSS
jgi:hypothetical protein